MSYRRYLGGKLETGGILISPQTGAIDLKPGSATKPFYGIKPVIVDQTGKTLTGACEGKIVHCPVLAWTNENCLW